MANIPPTFLHRHRFDGTYDSICTECFKTIANSPTKEGLFEAEKDHICLGYHLDSAGYLVNP